MRNDPTISDTVGMARTRLAAPAQAEFAQAQGPDREQKGRATAKPAKKPIDTGLLSSVVKFYFFSF